MIVETVAHEGYKDEDTPQWLSQIFEKKKKVVLPKITLQQEIIEEPRKTKKANTIHHLSRVTPSEVITDIESPI